MLGNLSKILIKAPNFFNNKDTNIRKRALQKIPEEIEVDPFYQINNIKSRSRNNINYFKEKDFWTKNFLLDMNFNHNKRYQKSTNILKNLKQSNYEKDLVRNNDADLRNQNIFKKRYSNSPRGDKNNLNIYQNIFLLQKDKLTKPEDNLKIQSNVLTDENIDFFKTEKNDEKTNKTYVMDRYNTENNNVNKNKYQKEVYKFPKNIKPYRSQESLFQDNIDNKLISLISLKPKFKEQLKSINRSMVGRRDYFLYQKTEKYNFQNPFYESMKKKEKLIKNFN